jgi:hypothetical protein
VSGAPQTGASEPAARRAGSVQETHFRIETLERDTVRLVGHEYRAVVECVGVAVHHLPMNEQEAALAGYAAFLNALPFPTQLLVRVQRRSLEPHIRDVQQSAAQFGARPETAALARVAAGYLEYLSGLHEQAVLLDRRCYVVIPADPRVVQAALPAKPTLRSRFLSLFARPQPAQDEDFEEEEDLPATGSAAEGPPPDPRDAIFTHLQFRCDQVIRLLARSGMQAWRVTGPGLFHLFYACWNPEQARLYPLDFERLAFHGGGGPVRSLVAQQVRRGGPPAGSPPALPALPALPAGLPARPGANGVGGRDKVRGAGAAYGARGVNGVNGVPKR